MGRIPRLLWLATFIWGAAIPWIAHRPPLIDLPQHAGQVALFRDLLGGASLWAHDLYLNFFTPYLTAYGLAAFLSNFVSTLASLKIVLSLGYVLFVAACVALRRQFAGDPRLDWLFLPGF